jgi:hypothetical protein
VGCRREGRRERWSACTKKAVAPRPTHPAWCTLLRKTGESGCGRFLCFFSYPYFYNRRTLGVPAASRGGRFPSRFTQMKSRRLAIGRFKNGARSSHGCGDRSSRRWLVGVVCGQGPLRNTSLLEIAICCIHNGVFVGASMPTMCCIRNGMFVGASM